VLPEHVSACGDSLLPRSDADATDVSDADLLLPMLYFGDGIDAVLPSVYVFLPR
jgi:hypothetical protein